MVGSAKSEGERVRFGRRLKLTPHQRTEALARREAGEPLAEIGRSYNVSHDFTINYRRTIIALGFLSSILSTGGAPLLTPTERM